MELINLLCVPPISVDYIDSSLRFSLEWSLVDIFIQRNGKCPSSSCLAILLNVGVISDWISISAQFDIDISDIGRSQNFYIGTPLQ